MSTQVCSICKIEKPLESFYLKRDGTRRLDCKSCVRKRNKKYETDHKDKINIRRKKFYHNHREVSLCKRYKIHDKRKNLIFNLTPEWTKEYITSKPCIYCNTNKPTGADRIDNSKGHTKDNVIPCCHNCNIIRGNRFTVDEMKLIGSFLSSNILNYNKIKDLL